MTTSTNRSIVQRTTGPIFEAARLVHRPMPQPTRFELLVELVVAPINPAELLMLEGRYGYGESRPSLPRYTGIEGVGRVIGGAVDIIAKDTLVSLAGASAVFSDYSVVRADDAVLVPDHIDPDTFALSFLNAQAALLMLQEWRELTEGDWIIQNAANSAFGRLVDVAAARRGVSVINVVRSESSANKIAETAIGPVVVDSADLLHAVLAQTGGARPKVAVDAVGGSSTGRLADLLQTGGRVVTYGLLSGEHAEVGLGPLVFNDISVEGFWMPQAMRTTSAEVLQSISTEAIDVIADPRISLPIHARYGLSDFREAFVAAAEGKRDGKVVLTR